MDPKEVTQMVTNRKEHNQKTPVKQGPEDIAPEPNKINASTPYDPVTFCYTSLLL
jgi:hypothetical protein